MYESTNERTNKPTNERTNERTYQQTHTNKHTNKHPNKLTNTQKKQKLTNDKLRLMHVNCEEIHLEVDS